jgi:hypothetical protein
VMESQPAAPKAAPSVTRMAEQLARQLHSSSHDKNENKPCSRTHHITPGDQDYTSYRLNAANLEMIDQKRTAKRAEEGSFCTEGSSMSSPNSTGSSKYDQDSTDSQASECEGFSKEGPTRLPKKKKLDRSKLRKGKWTVRVHLRATDIFQHISSIATNDIAFFYSLLQVEEEEYTSRIIHYFSIGLLALPEGSTLRAYLADKLNCDPMRITKKYAGASCLGRRVLHFQDRPQPSAVEFQLAKAELDLLEKRFRTRVEEGCSSVILPQIDFSVPFINAPSHPMYSGSRSLPFIGAAIPPNWGCNPMPINPPIPPALSNSAIQSLLLSLAARGTSAPQPVASPLPGLACIPNFSAGGWIPNPQRPAPAAAVNTNSTLLNPVVSSLSHTLP